MQKKLKKNDHYLRLKTDELTLRNFKLACIKTGQTMTQVMNKFIREFTKKIENN